MRRFYLTIGVLAFAAAVSVAGCGPSSIATQRLTPVPSSPATATPSPSAVQALWAIAGDTVVEFSSAQFTGGTINPIVQFSVASVYTGYTGMAFDSLGNLWVTEDNPTGSGSAPGQIVEFSSAELAALAANPSPSPAVTLAVGGFAEGVAFDQSGNLWASVLSDTTGGQFQEFRPAQLSTTGMPAPAITLLQNKYEAPGAFVFGSDGTLWYAPTSAIFGPAGGTIFGLSLGQLASSGSPAPAYTLTDTNAPEVESGQEAIFVGPNQVAFDGAGNLWSIFDGYCFAFGATTLHSASPAPLYGFQAYPSQQTTGTIEAPPYFALAFDATSDLIVDDKDSLSAHMLDEFTPAQYGEASPSPITAQYGSSVPPYTSGVGDFIIRGPYVSLGAVSLSGSRSK
jgi:hypothetical protein